MQLLILGMHRSGTSAASRIINMMGAYFAPPGMEIPAHSDNPKGFWERKDAMAINDQLLALQDCAWNKVGGWRFENQPPVPYELQQRMQGLIDSLDDRGTWFLKDPRMCLTLPSWLPALRRPVAVAVFRHPGEIALSLQTRNQMKLRYALALWEYYAVGLLNSTMRMPRISVQHTDLINRPVKTAEVLLAQLHRVGADALSMPAAEDIRGFIDKNLHRERSETKATPALSPHQLLLAGMLQGSESQTDTVEVSVQSREIIARGPNG